MNSLPDGILNEPDRKYQLARCIEELRRLWIYTTNNLMVYHDDGTASFPEGSIGDQIIRQIIKVINDNGSVGNDDHEDPVASIPTVDVTGCLGGTEVLVTLYGSKETSDFNAAGCS